MEVSKERGRLASSDDGFTLIELLVTMTLGSILMTIGILAMHNYMISQREAGTAVDVRSALRSASEQSLSQGRTFCVLFTSTTWAVYKSSCSAGGTKVSGPFTVDDQSITLTGLSFIPPVTPVTNQTTACPAANACAYFYPRGTALGGSVQVTRSSKTYTISVEELTSRVSMA
jgi:prepilin-type N-terminal cleavage/methylation domain-containing protein